MLFTRRQILSLLLPLMLEQLLSGLMGIADTMMVTTVGESAISAVSLVDTVNVLMLNLLSALAAGGVIVCSQYLGRGEAPKAANAARQVLLVSLGLGLACGYTHDTYSPRKTLKIKGCCRVTYTQWVHTMTPILLKNSVSSYQIK